MSRHLNCSCLLSIMKTGRGSENKMGTKCIMWINELGFSSYPHTKGGRGVPGYSPAGRFLHPLVAVQDAFEKLCHEGFEVGVGGLGDHPMCIATQSPAGNGANQGFFVTQTLDEMGDQLWQVGHHALHAAWRTEKEETMRVTREKDGGGRKV